MNGWTDDPELVAIFRAEVDEKLESLRDGLMSLEAHPSPRQVVASLFRDAHTVKGSARALALDGVVGLAHRAEDLLGALRDGRFDVRRDIVDLLLVTAEGISRSMPGARQARRRQPRSTSWSPLSTARSPGTTPSRCPSWAAPPRWPDAPPLDVDAGRPRLGDSVRVPTRRVHDLLDLVGETDLVDPGRSTCTWRPGRRLVRAGLATAVRALRRPARPRRAALLRQRRARRSRRAERPDVRRCPRGPR